MTSQVNIYGAGMAGLLVANMLRRLSPVVHEAQTALPDNHGALLRFRSDVVAKATGQVFRKVRVQKSLKFRGSFHHEATIQSSNAYSLKVTGEVMPRSILNLVPAERFIAPDNFIATMARGSDIQLGSPLSYPEPGISTIPMPVLMDIVGWKDRPEFLSRPIWSFVLKLTEPKFSAYQTIYYPDLDLPYYRASLTGNKLTIEYVTAPTFEQAAVDDAAAILEDFGIPSEICRFDCDGPKYHHYGKLLPIPERERRAFILAMTQEFGIYSVGRFATWRQILLDDVVNDVEIVARWIEEKDHYARHLSLR